MSRWGDHDAGSLIKRPPEGVDLHALGSSGSRLLTPEECAAKYQEAFEAAGGDAALEPKRELSKKLVAQLPGRRATQPKAWQSQSLHSMLERMGRGAPVRDFGENCIRELARGLKTRDAVVLEVPGEKQWDRASVKTRIKYGLDCSKLVDMNRATIVCADIDDLYRVLEQLFAAWGPLAKRESMRILEFEDHYFEAMGGGYRHLQVVAALAGCCWEIQLNTASMVRAKKEAGHRLYKTTRFVKEMLLFTAMEGDISALEQLVQYEGVQEVADPNAVRDMNGLSALHYAAFNGMVDIMAVLRDPAKVRTRACLWTVDSDGNLPLNYAAMMQHWQAVEWLTKEMSEETCSADNPEVQPQEVQDCIARAAAFVVDAMETVPHMLVPLAKVWENAGGNHSSSLSPVRYAFDAGVGQAILKLLEGGQLDPWAVDAVSRLPIERALQLGEADVSDAIAAKMPETKPVRPSAAAAWSLVRCKGAQVSGLTDLIQLCSEKVNRRVYACGGPSDKSQTLKEFDALTLRLVNSAPIENMTISALAVGKDVLFAGTTTGEICRFQCLGLKALDPVKARGTKSAHSQAVTYLLPWPPTDPKQLTSASNDNTVKVWSFSGSTVVLAHTLKFSADVNSCARLGDFLYTASGSSIVRFDLSFARSLAALPRKTMSGHTGTVEALLAHKDQLYSGGRGGEVRCWNKCGNPLGMWKGHTEGYRVLALSADGSIIYSVAVRDTDDSSSGSDSLRLRARRRSAFEMRGFGGQSEVRAWSTTGEMLHAWSDANFSVHLCGDVWSLNNIVVLAEIMGKVHVRNGQTCAELAEVEAFDGFLGVFAVTGHLCEDVNTSAAAEVPTESGVAHTSENRRDLLKAAFRRYDEDRNGRLTKAEIKAMLMEGDKHGIMSERVAELLLSAMDDDGDGLVSCEEFVDYIFAPSNLHESAGLDSGMTLPAKEQTLSRVLFDGGLLPEHDSRPATVASSVTRKHAPHSRTCPPPAARHSRPGTR